MDSTGCLLNEWVPGRSGTRGVWTGWARAGTIPASVWKGGLVLYQLDACILQTEGEPARCAVCVGGGLRS